MWSKCQTERPLSQANNMLRNLGKPTVVVCLGPCTLKMQEGLPVTVWYVRAEVRTGPGVGDGLRFVQGGGTGVKTGSSERRRTHICPAMP